MSHFQLHSCTVSAGSMAFRRGVSKTSRPSERTASQHLKAVGRSQASKRCKPFTEDNLAKWQQSCEVLSMARQNSLRLRSTGAFSRAPIHLQSLLPGLMLMDYEPPLGSWPSGNSDPFWVTWHKHVAGNMWRKKGTVWCWVATEAVFIGEPVVPVLSFWNSCHCGWQTLKVWDLSIYNWHPNWYMFFLFFNLCIKASNAWFWVQFSDSFL